MKKKLELAHYGAIICLLLFAMYGMVDCFVGLAFHLTDGDGLNAFRRLELALVPLYGFAFLVMVAGLFMKKTPALLTIGAGFFGGVLLLDWIWFFGTVSGSLYFIRPPITMWIPMCLSYLLQILFFVLMLFWKDKLPRFWAMVLCWLPAMIIACDLFGVSPQSVRLVEIYLSLLLKNDDARNVMYAIAPVAEHLEFFAMLALKLIGLLLLARTVTGERAAMSCKVIRVVGIVGIGMLMVTAGLKVLLAIMADSISHSLLSIFVLYYLPAILMCFWLMFVPAAVIPVRKEDWRARRRQIK